MRSQSPPIATFGQSVLQGLARAPVFVFRQRWLAVATLLLVLLWLTVLVPRFGGGFRYETWKPSHYAMSLTLPPEAKTPKELEKKLAQKKKQYQTTMNKALPTGKYIVIDQTHNHIELRQGENTILDAVCSAGSGMMLAEGGGGRTWVFDTPRGRFKVLDKIRNPVWRKPDWAFVEEGKPIPKDPAERIEPGSLGEFALPFGNGYLIHGTLYERLLGRSVTHGCIRVGREDLRVLFRETPIGTPIYIY
jgi:L,D-transpeptidase YbiS